MASRNSIILNGTDGQVPIASSTGTPQYATITSTGGTITFTLGHNTLNMEANMAIPTPVVTAYTTPGTFTWTKSTNCQNIQILVINGGGGGGSGARGLTTATPGGGGGGSGSGMLWYGPANFFGATETVTVASGGAGGISVTVDNTNGNNGSVGGVSSFGSILKNETDQISGSTSFGLGGNIISTVGSGGLGQSLFSVSQFNASYGTLGANSGFLSSRSGGDGRLTSGGDSLRVFNNSWDGFRSGCGGGGGGADSTTARSGGTGDGIGVFGTDSVPVWIVTPAAGGIETGTVNGSTGSAGDYLGLNGMMYYGTGGGGGGGMKSIGAGAGGDGGFPGGAGGGGGASINANPSGAGGAGANGIVVVWEYYS